MTQEWDAFKQQITPPTLNLCDLEVRAIAKLTLKPGDILVVFVPKGRSAELAPNIRRTNQHLLPSGVTTLIVEEGFDLKVLHPEPKPPTSV